MKFSFFESPIQGVIDSIRRGCEVWAISDQQRTQIRAFLEGFKETCRNPNQLFKAMINELSERLNKPDLSNRAAKDELMTLLPIVVGIGINRPETKGLIIDFIDELSRGGALPSNLQTRLLNNLDVEMIGFKRLLGMVVDLDPSSKTKLGRVVVSWVAKQVEVLAKEVHLVEVLPAIDLARSAFNFRV